MKKIFFLLCCLPATPLLGDFIWDMKTDEQRAQLAATETAFVQGDLGPIHEAYVKRDLKLLWQIVQRTGTFSMRPEMKAQLENPAEVGLAIHKTVSAYTRRLLSQIPGHAKLIGDEIDLIAGERDRLTQAGRETYLHTLADLGSDESIHEIGRFIDDPRGVPTPEDVAEDKKALAEKRYADRGKYGVGSAYAVNMDARQALWEAVFQYPFERDPRNKGKMLFMSPEQREKTDAWWKSAASAKYRQPIDLTRQPPEEPPPARFDIKAIYKKPQAEKSQAALALPKPSSSPPSPAQNAAEAWPLYVAAGGALACLLWVYAKKSRS